MKRILINAVQKEEIRVAMVDGQQLYDLDIEIPSLEQKKANVYKGKITRVEPSLEAAFVDYGAERHGFLPFKEISRNYFSEEALKTQGRPDIKTAVHEGQEVVVQVEKEERGNKGAALTTFISLAGRFLVLMPNNPRAGGVSRRIEGEDRNIIRESLAQLDIPGGMGLIVRTAGVGRSVDELQWDLEYLLQLWRAFEKAAKDRPAAFLIYQESNVIVRALRDYFRTDINEVLIDSEKVYGSARQFLEQVMPERLNKLKLYSDSVPLFNRFQIENQIESAYRREVQLPSGGAIVIDHTEALTSIDINSARATRGGDIEETALNTNLEAADEIARQLRLRDLGGLIVIDFIDMVTTRNQREVENRLRDAVKIDRARVQIGRISRFGLLEMSRQRLKPSLGESTQIVCPRCIGHGTIRTVESLALSLIRIMEEEALKENSARVDVHVPVDVATYMLNEKRKAINEIEQQTGIRMVVIANSTLETPQYRVERIRKSEIDEGSEVASYKQVEDVGEHYNPADYKEKVIQPEQPAVTAVVPSRPAPLPTVQPSGGLLTKIVSLFTSDDSKSEAKSTKVSESRANAPARREGRGGKAQTQTGQGRSRGGRKPAQGQKGAQRGEQQSRRRGAKQSGQQGGKIQKKAEAKAKPKAETKAKAETKTTDQVTESREKATESKPRSRGRRGGRGRRGSGRQRQAEARQANETQEQPQVAQTKPVAQKPEPNSESRPEQAKQEKTATEAAPADREQQKGAAEAAPADRKQESVSASASPRRKQEKPVAENEPAPSKPTAASESPSRQPGNKESTVEATKPAVAKQEPTSQSTARSHEKDVSAATSKPEKAASAG
ncbi:MAG: ribonuclease E, partial [Gammaproteobacteria bacterium]|nr:ribonuclease E [Gammaproteobacteria bacterium]